MSFRREEWTASIAAGIGSIWFVSAITTEFPRLVQWVAPVGGPTEVICLALLLWLHAKYLRHRNKAALQAEAAGA